MNPWSGLKKIPRNIWLISFATLINRSGTMVLPYLVLYLTRNEGITPSKAGIVLSLYGAGALITSPFVGKLSDKIGSMRIMKYSLLFTSITLVCYSFVHEYLLFLMITLILSVISEAFRPANLSYISIESSPEQRKTAFALNRLAINLGMSIGPVVGGLLAMFDFSLLFYVNGFSTFTAWVFLVLAKFEPHSSSKLEKDETIKPDQSISQKPNSILKDKNILLFYVALVPVMIVFFQHIGAFPLYLVHELKHTEVIFGLLMAVNTVLIIFIEVPLNNAMSNWSDKKSLVLGSILCGLGYGAMLISPELWWIIITIVIWTFGEMIFFPASASYISIVSDDSRRGEYMGYFQMTFSFSFMMGPWIGTLLFENYGAGSVWAVSLLLSLISGFIFLRIRTT
jgi:MFS family permease